MTQTPLDRPGLWAEIQDPDEPAQRVRADLTWLTSRWHCLYAEGRCPGIDAGAPDAGCCTLGAHFTDADDLARVTAVVESLGADEWQLRGTGRTEGWWVTDEDGSTSTRVVDGACVLLNRGDFPGGPGCALHRHAVDRGLEPLTTKPDVCWQLPLRREYREVSSADGTSHLEISVGEYDRRGWGPGGHDLDWYCTNAPEAHTGSEPVFVSLRAELVELLGPAAYAELARACEVHLAAVEALGGPGGRPLLPLHVHPATRAAQGGSPRPR
ncbi:hypothetical protein [Ornithinimicrobium flavum]|uniref:hypothetical protein n=1 Tax=Ornithinimicrobium flavum TaxID=1288636 RepID=UPI00106F11AB|nr:hypothetical protein [Ornithinimicrobium flavum]